ncbi:MAG: outer membrane lipoprotein-sorting protein [Gammaproteobacteria bacterium]|nr:outer membrane lipoprotein-sorting protein [Gammaproteobacteria bacterium]MDH5735118.1 outer membrane lipoprotein-sorting protein [Gammaproteobacteria bacterium]
MNHAIQKLIISWCTILLLSVPVQTVADENKGLEIAKEADRRDTGYKDSTARLVMELKNKQGDTAIRHVRVKNLEVIGDGDKGMSIFDEPADVKGTAFLTFSHSLTPDEQWLYLPSLKRIKRISSKNKSGPFMGSEFAYEDISSQEVDKYTYKYIKDEVLNGIDCFLIERYPAYEHSGYTRQLVWVNKNEYRPEKIVFYDRKDTLLKTLNYSHYKQYLGQYWRAEKMHMQNHQTGKSTLLSWFDYAFKTGLNDSDFSRNSLKRAK